MHTLIRYTAGNIIYYMKTNPFATGNSRMLQIKYIGQPIVVKILPNNACSVTDMQSTCTLKAHTNKQTNKNTDRILRRK